MKKILLISSFLMLISYISAYCQNISNVPTPKKETMNAVGWSTTYDINDKNWVAWGLRTPILEKREVRNGVNKDGIPFNYYWGSFYLCNNSIIITVKYKTFYEREIVHFLFDYGWDSKKGENCYRKVKDAVFSHYGNNASYAYSNDEDLVNWVKEELKNKTSEIAPIQVMVTENNGFGYYYPMITYDLYPYSEKEITNCKKVLFSRPEDKRVTETERLDVYPTPINSNKTIKDYIDWKLANTQGYYCPKKSAWADVEFMIETDGSVSNLIIDGAEFRVGTRDYKQCLDVEKDLKGFNNWVAGIINSITFNPGKLNGNPVRTFCKFEINYKNNNIREFRGVNIVYNGEKYGIINEDGRLNYSYVFDDLIILDNTDLEVIINGKHGILQDVHKKSGNGFIVPIQYDSIIRIYQGEGYYGLKDFYYIAIKDGRRTIYDKWEEMFTLDYNIDVSLFDRSSEMWKTQNLGNKKQGIVTKNGKEVLACEFEGIGYYDSKEWAKDKGLDLFIVKKEGKFGIIRWDHSSLGDIENGRNSNQYIPIPKMWFDDLDIKHNSLIQGNKDNRFNYTFWVKMDRNEGWGLVRINKSGSVDVLLMPEFDNVNAYNEVSKGNKTYRIIIDENEKAKKTKIRK